VFCSVDDFCQVFEQQWQSQLLSHDLQMRKRKRSLYLSEVMTILIGFHQSYYRNFKSYYLEKVQTQWQSHFPKLVSYNRFIEWIPDTLIPLCGYLRSCFGTCTGISFMDSTCLKVCHNRRINQHKVFKDVAARGKTSVDWFFGLKLHLVIMEKVFRLGLVFALCLHLPTAASPTQQIAVKSFAIWCQERNSVAATTRHTIDVLLKEADTENCQRANRKLSSFVSLSLIDRQISDLKPLARAC
jgi:Transposase DDE domain